MNFPKSTQVTNRLGLLKHKVSRLLDDWFDVLPNCVYKLKMNLTLLNQWQQKVIGTKRGSRGAAHGAISLRWSVK